MEFSTKLDEFVHHMGEFKCATFHRKKNQGFQLMSYFLVYYLNGNFYLLILLFKIDDQYNRRRSRLKFT